MLIASRGEYRTYKRPDSVEVPTKMPEMAESSTAR